MILRNTLLVVLLCCFYSSLQAECTTETIGLCTEGITTENTTTEIIETTVENKDSGDLLDSDNGFVTNSKDGSMSIDWGGKGSASMPSGSYCNELGTDKCAEITDSTLTTFYQEVDISSLDITNGGRTNYTIKVDKQDSQDSIYMKINGNNGNEQIFTGTDILSETGVTTGYQSYTGGFDFGGILKTITIEIGGKDINLAVGVLFDDVSINILYNVVSTIVTQQIKDLEEFLILDYGQDANDVAEMIFESNEVTDDFNFQSIEESIEEPTFESVEIELQEFEIDFQIDMDIDVPEIVMVPTNIDIDPPVEITVASVEMDIEMEIDIQESEVEVETVEEPETTDVEEVEEPQEPEPKKVEEPKKEATPKQKAATKIVKDMGDKGRYEESNQIKTLIVMNILSNSKDFFNVEQSIPDIEGFFNNDTLPDTSISDNNMAAYILFGGSDSTYDQMVDAQYN